jgi:hypothetical protein
VKVIQRIPVAGQVCVARRFVKGNLVNFELRKTKSSDALCPQFKICGESRIRTYEDISQQSYSLPQLAALVSPRFFKNFCL